MSEAFAGWPGWDGLHPLWVHFPVAWLLSLPIVLLVALLSPAARSRQVLQVAFWLALVSVGAAWLALATGEASSQVVALPPGGELQLARHEALGEALIASAAGLAAGMGAILFLRPLARHLDGRRSHRVILAAALGASLGVALLASATAHAGGRLVHELGVRAWSPGAAPATR